MKLDFEILQFFVYKKIIKKREFDKILAESQRLNMPVERYLLAQGICNEIAALEAMGEFFQMPYIQLDMLEVDEKLLDQFELSFLRAKKLVPITMDVHGTMILACARPLDLAARSAVASVYSGSTAYILVPQTQIDVFIDGQIAIRSTATALKSIHHSLDAQSLEKGLGSGKARLGSAEDVINAPTVQLVDSIIKEAIPFRASDIHIEPFETYVTVRYRIDGKLNERARFHMGSYPAIAARLKILSGINIAERRIPQDGRINMNINGTEYDFRVSTLPTVHGEKFVIRVLDKSAFQLSRQELGFTQEANTLVDKMLARPYGIILMSGPTGCGKSTTLYTFLREINKPDINIVTVEDPVEYTMPGVNQVNVNNKANMTFASALRSIMRQDPDVIMIGEIRDEETAQIAVRAAITGHLVFSTIHTNDAPGVLTRLTDMGISNYFVADALIGVISQRLVKRLCPACKRKGKTNLAEMQAMGLTEAVSICRPRGCQFCGNTGYRGRVAVHEIMCLNDELREALAKDISAEQLRELAQRSGMRTIWQNCRDYVLRGITSVQELMALYME